MLRRETIRVCSICGKSEGAHWKRHWQRRHPRDQIKELIPGQEPLEPFDQNWLFLIKDIETRQTFDTSAKNQRENEFTQREAYSSIDQDTINKFHSQLADFEPSFVEIDVESDGEQFNNLEKKFIVDDDIQSIPTQELFKMAKTIMTTLQERLIAKDKSLRQRQDLALSQRQVREQPLFRHIFKSNGGCHLSMSRVINEPHVQHSNPSWVASSVQFAFNIQTIPINQWKVDYLFQEIQKVKTYIKQVDTFIGNLHEMSFPTLMTINESNVEVKISEQSLCLRSKQLLKRGRWAPKPYMQPTQQTIYNSTPDDPATYCPLLYGPMEALGDDKPEGPQEINTDFIDCGDDLTNGVIAIDGVRFLMQFVRKMITKILLIDLKDGFIEIFDDWRAFLNRKLQYFINMLLFAEIGTCKQKVRVNFKGCYMEPREFTVNVKPKEYRESKNDSNYHLRQLLEVSKEITEAVVAIKDFTVAFGEIKVDDKDFELLLPIVKRVNDSIQYLKNGKDIDHSHRLKNLAEVVKEEKERLDDPQLIENLKEEVLNSKFYSTVDLKALAKWKLMKEEFKNKPICDTKKRELEIFEDKDQPKYD